jgi:hypothetical protein
MSDHFKLRLIAFLTRNIAVLAASAVALVLVIGGAAHAVTDTVFKYTNPRTGFFTIDPMALTPDPDFRTYTTSYNAGNLTGTGCFNTGVNLPNGATITALTVWFASGASSDPSFFFVRRDLTTGNPDTFVNGVSVHDDSTARKGHTFKIPNTAIAKVDGVHSYGFGVCFPDATNSFLGARVAYTFTTAGD